MTDSSALERGAAWAIHNGLGVRPGERVLVVVDSGRSGRIGEALTAALRSASLDGIVLSTHVHAPGEPPPEAVVEAMERADAILAATTTSMTYTDAVLDARRRGARIITAPLLTEGALARTAEVEPDEIRRLTEAVGRSLARARSLQLTSPAGTDLRIALGGHPPDLLDGQCRGPGEYDQLPPGVASVLSASTDGKVVVDAAVTQVGTVAEPVRLVVRESRIVAIEGGAEADRLRRALAATDDPDVYHCAAEIGVGTNRWACYEPGSEFRTECARVLGRVHVGFGDDHTLPGGTVRAKMHNDALLGDCTLLADGEPIVEDGRLAAGAGAP